MGSSGSKPQSPPQTIWQKISTAFGCSDWFNFNNIPTCFGNLSLPEKVYFCFIVLYIGGGLAAAIIILGDLAIGGEGFIEDASDLFQDLASMIEWLSGFLESAFEYLVAAGALAVNEIMNLANSIGASTGTPPLLWLLLALLAMVWAGSFLIKEIINESESFKNSDAYPVFYVLNSPIRWIVEGLKSALGTWAGALAQVIAFPINCVLVIVSEILALIWSSLKAFF